MTIFFFSFFLSALSLLSFFSFFLSLSLFNTTFSLIGTLKRRIKPITKEATNKAVFLLHASERSYIPRKKLVGEFRTSIKLSWDLSESAEK